MTFTEYISKYYDVTEKIRARIINPIEAVRLADGLPCDDILFLEGELQKIVYLDVDTPISVAELVGYTQDEIDKMGNEDLTILYENYMENIITSDLDVKSIIEAAQIFMKGKRDKRKAQLSCIR